MYDIIIIGGGIVGLTVARELSTRFKAKIALLEKEETVAKHASGRNSGVLHAGFYYASDTLKARLCRDGNRLMKEYCKANGLKLLECGKVVVTKNEQELNTLHTLEKRGKQNGVDVRLIDENELRRIEPNAATFGQALYSPSTSVVDPVQVCNAIARELAQKGIDIKTSTQFIRSDGSDTIVTNKGSFQYKYLINCAGAFADRVAHTFGVGTRYTILPFRGDYLELIHSKTHLVNANIYPVPDLRNPFLGIHFTRTADGHVIIGPTATPVLSRENYHLCKNIDLADSVNNVTRLMAMLIQNKGNLRGLAIDEIKRQIKYCVFLEAKQLIPSVQYSDLQESEHSGIRAQLVDIHELKLIMDFVVQHGKKSTHVLNAVSPAFTSSFPFAKYIVDQFMNEVKPSI